MPLDAATDSYARTDLRNHVVALSQKLFDRPGLLAYWQELAENFYVERADFSVTRNTGAEFASNLMSSYPVVGRRELGDLFSTMLRPSAKPWFKMGVQRQDKLGTTEKQWLEWATGYERGWMYAKKAGLLRACRETDHDFATFGQAAMEHDVIRPADGGIPHALFRNVHLRDIAWKEGLTGEIDTIMRRRKIDATTMNRMFRGKVHRKVKEKLEKEPFYEFNLVRAVIPADMYREMPGGREIRQPWVSMYVDVDNDNFELECLGRWTRGYIIPRWQTVSGSQYAHSAAMVAALPDARLLQAVTLVLLQAGEKAVDPPMVGTEDVVRSDVALYAGGITWVSEEYDERLGEALRPVTLDTKGLAFGLELARDIRVALRDALYLSKLQLPPMGGPEMTAYEVGQRVQEFIRNALPLFEPVETDYNGWLCEDVFTELWHLDPTIAQSMPRTLFGQERTFTFENPLRESIDKAKAGQLLEAQQIITAAAQTDPTAVVLIDTKKAVRDVLGSIAPNAWLRTEDEVARIEANEAAKQQQAQLLALMQQGTDVAKTGAEAAATASQAFPPYGPR